MAIEVSIPPGYGQLTVSYAHAGISHTAMSVIGFQTAGAPFDQAHLDALWLAWANAVDEIHDAEVSYPRAVALVGQDGPPFRFEGGGLHTGARSAPVEIAPPQVCYLLRKATVFSGHRYRGRLYLPFVPETFIFQTGALEPTEFALLGSVAAKLNAIPGTAGLNVAKWVLLHGSEPPAVAPAPTIVTAIQNTSYVATQRRRLRRG